MGRRRAAAGDHHAAGAMMTSRFSDKGTPSARLSRAEFMRWLGVAAAALIAPAAPAAPAGAPRAAPLLTRRIPRSGEAIPAVGLGTWLGFDAGSGAAERAPLAEVLRRFFAAGGRLIDSSPMYGRAETVVGDLLAELGLTRPASGAAGGGAVEPFLATKVWTTGREEGRRQMAASLQALRTGRLDLMQVHNLVDWRTQLATMREWQGQGRLRHIGVTHYLPSAFGDLERLVRTERLDFVQLPYSLALTGAEQRLLPAAAAEGVAVIVNRPFEGGDLFRAVRGKPLPPWAEAFECRSWAQFFLKYILAHPAVTCVIPGTAKPQHIDDDLAAARGPLPDEATRRRMVAFWREL